MSLKHFLLLTLLLSLSTLTVSSAADDDLAWSLSLTDDGITIRGCVASCPADLIIPKTIDGKNVTSIGNSAFRDKQLASVYLPDTLVSIGRLAFAENQISTLELPVSLTIVDDNAFSSNELSNLVIPDNVVVLGDRAFDQNKLVTLKISANIESIGVGVFSTNLLSSLVLPNTIKSIGNFAFYRNELVSLALPASLESIGYQAFAENHLADVTLPLRLKEISFGAFEKNLMTSLTLPASLERLYDMAWRDNNVTQVVYKGPRPERGPNSVSSWGPFFNNPLEFIGYCTGQAGWPGVPISSITPIADCDGDRVADGQDAFPLDATETLDTDSDGTGNNADTDDDGDGVLDGTDAFPLDATETLDTDSDGTGNNADTDDDGDGVADGQDAFPLDATEALDTDVDGTGNNSDTDDDNDGVEDTSDAFPLDASETVDSDNDGVGDNSDAFPDDAAESVDSDSDSVGDNADNCPSLSNTNQLNTDGDQEGDACDSDDDNDGILDADEFSFVVDADQDDRTLPFSDGLVFARFAAGLTNNSLTTGLGVVVDETQYSSNLEQKEFDVDGDGTQKYINDGFRLIAALSGVCIENLPSDGNVRTCDEQASYLKPFTKVPPIIQRRWPDSASNSLELVVDVASAASQGLVKVRYKNEGNDPLYGFVMRVFYSSSEVQGLALKDNFLENDSSGVFTFFDDDDSDLDANSATDKVFSYLAFGLFEQNGFSVNPKPLISASTSGDAFNLSFDAAANAAFFPYITELPFGFTATNPSSVSDLTFTDSDSDGWGNDFDNCSSIFNPEQNDFDSDSFGDACDSDDDGDGSPDASDAFPLDATEILDTDSDGTGNNADTDDDGDSVADDEDAFPLDASESIDTDGDGIGNNADTDDDNDGVPDANDGYALISLGALLDTDSDGFPNECDENCLATGMTADSDDDNDGVADIDDFFPLDASESSDKDGDGVGDNSDAFPDNINETVDSDVDGIGDNSDNCPNVQNDDQINTDGDLFGNACDLDDDNDGFTDAREEQDGTDPLNRFSCKSGCFSFDVDESLQAQPLTDGLLVIRHLFGFSGDSLISGAVSGEANRDSSEAITGYLTEAVSELDIDGDGESKPLTDGLLLIRYLFGFSGESLVSGAIGSGAERDTAEEVEAYIKERVPAS